MNAVISHTHPELSLLSHKSLLAVGDESLAKAEDYTLKTGHVDGEVAAACVRSHTLTLAYTDVLEPE